MITKECISNLREALNGKKITILGHDNIDVDSFLSGILLSNFLNFLDIENEFCILEEVKENDTYAIVKELFGIDMKAYHKVNESIERNLFLVDHYETKHEGNVIAIVDHHPSRKKSDCEFKYVTNSCATAYMIYELMQQAKFPFTKEDVKMVVVSMLIDTVSFKSTKTIEEEAMFAKKLAYEYEIDFDFLYNYGMRLTEISKMSEEEIILNGVKWYNYKKNNDVASSYLQLIDMPSKEICNHWIELIRSKLSSEGTRIWVFIIYDMKKNETYEYQITLNKIYFSWHAKILSRGNDIMPKVEEKFLYS